MSSRLRFTILGCGASPGVPRVTNDWGACDPSEPRNRRTRCSLLIERFAASVSRPTVVLVDTGPDLREQLLRANVQHVDAVIYTHAHADHLHGIDDLRAFWQNSGRRVDVYSDQTTEQRLFEAFGYCFKTPTGSTYPPILNHHRIQAGATLTIGGEGGAIDITTLRQRHGDIDTLALRIGNVAYSCDVSDIPAEAEQGLHGLGVWIVDGLRYKPHPSHFTVDEAIAWSRRLGVRRTILTHMHSDLDYQTLKRDLPPDIEPAYDGMIVEEPV